MRTIYAILLLALVCSIQAKTLPKLHQMFFDPTVTNEVFAKTILNEKLNINHVLTNIQPQLYAPRSAFKLQGEHDCFNYIAQGNKHTHAICYYIPESLQPTDVKIPVLTFLHGGGPSTATYEAARERALSYMRGFRLFAEKNKTILIFPSSSLGWDFSTPFLLREIKQLALRNLPVDSNRFVLAGHSMGAQGIAREYPWLSDVFSGYLALSGGISNSFYENENFLLTLFNSTYIHLNGLNDSFKKFHPSMTQFASKVRKIEKKLNTASNFRYFTHDGEHEINAHLAHEQLIYLLSQKRNLYQPNLYPVYTHLNFGGTETKPSFPAANLNRYFWLEVSDSDTLIKDKSALSTFKAKIVKNHIQITTVKNDHNFKKIHIYLSRHFVDFKKTITVSVDEEIIFKGMIAPSLNKTVEIARAKKDPLFIFENKISLKLPQRTMMKRFMKLIYQL